MDENEHALFGSIFCTIICGINRRSLFSLIHTLFHSAKCISTHTHSLSVVIKFFDSLLFRIFKIPLFLSPSLSKQLFLLFFCVFFVFFSFLVRFSLLGARCNRKKKTFFFLILKRPIFLFSETLISFFTHTLLVHVLSFSRRSCKLIKGRWKNGAYDYC